VYGMPSPYGGGGHRASSEALPDGAGYAGSGGAAHPGRQGAADGCGLLSAGCPAAFPGHVGPEVAAWRTFSALELLRIMYAGLRRIDPWMDIEDLGEEWEMGGGWGERWRPKLDNE